MQTPEALAQQVSRQVHDRRVLDALSHVPRDRFIPAALRDQAYDDVPLPIGAGQTISQPTIVGMMTEALALTGIEHVLEIGTGSGYQAAVLARLAHDVVTVEIVDSLRLHARQVLEELGITNVLILPAGTEIGAPEHAPFDAIVVTAAAPNVPLPLVAQLRVGGRLVIPVGDRLEQRLVVVTKTETGTIERVTDWCRFVPLVGPYGFEPVRVSDEDNPIEQAP